MKKFKRVLLAVIASITVIGGALAFQSCSCTDDNKIIITPTPEETKYTVTWKNGDTVLETDQMVENSVPSYDSAVVPSKASDVEWSYTFIGWAIDSDSTTGEINMANLPKITGDTTFYAIFTNVARKYTVIWKNGSETLETSTDVAALAQPEYTKEKPTKAPTVSIVYEFAGWNTNANASVGVPNVADLEPVTGNTVYYAIFTASPRKYTINFRNGPVGNYDGEETYEVEYNNFVPRPVNTPVMTDSGDYSYEFAGWVTETEPNKIYRPGSPLGKGLPKVTEAMDYYAAFNAISKTRATVIYWSFDGLERLGIKYVDAADPAYVLETAPLRDETAKYIFTPGGWQLTPASLAAEGIADDGVDTIDIDDVDDLAKVYELYAVYTAEIQKYSITFLDADDEEFHKQENIPYETKLKYQEPNFPEKAGTAGISYEFKGWKLDKDSDIYYAENYEYTVYGDMVLYPHFEAVVKKYDIVFRNNDNSDIKTVLTEYGAIPENTEEPTYVFPGEDGYVHEFIGWYLKGANPDTATVNLTELTEEQIINDESADKGKVVYIAAYRATNVFVSGDLELAAIEDGNAFVVVGLKPGLTAAPGVITIPNTVNEGKPVKEISDYAFSGLSSTLVNGYFNVVIAEGNNLTKIGDYAFAGSKLRVITLKEGLKTIGFNAFFKTSIQTIKLPASVEVIDRAAFMGSQLASITFDDNSELTTLGNQAFENTPLVKIKLPKGLVKGRMVLKSNGEVFDELFTNMDLSYQYVPFKDCRELESITVQEFGSHPALWQDGNGVYIKKNGNNNHTLLFVPNTTAGESFTFTVHSKCVAVMKYAFAYRTEKLKKVFINETNFTVEGFAAATGLPISMIAK